MTDTPLQQPSLTAGAPNRTTPGHFARSFSADTANLMAALGGLGFAAAGVAAIAATAVGSDEFLHPRALLATGIVASTVGVALFVASRGAAQSIVRYFHLWTWPALVGAPLCITVAQWAVGPIFQIAVLVYVEVPVFAYFFLRPRWAACFVALPAAMYATVVTVQDGYRLIGVQIAFVLVTLQVVGFMFGKLIASGIDEAERAGQLRRFLAPQVAEAALTTGDESLLEPHRRQIAVLFCDLRGFTAYAASAEPEEVVEVLSAYMAAVGTTAHQHGATIGAFAGDGVMAYFNDPFPCPEPAQAAIALALASGPLLDELVAGWERRGIHLSYGIGVAYGYATLGVFGFEGRNDYTALGSVVNLAARLSDCAGPTEVLIDARAHEAVAGQIPGEPRDVVLKGFHEHLTVFSIRSGGE